MQRHELIEAMQALGLKGMAGAFDEIFSLAVKRQRAPEAIIGELLKAEQTERQMRSIRYRISAVKLPETKDLIGFEFEETPINAPLVRSLHEGDFLAEKRNIVFVGEAGTGKTHLAIAIAANVVRNGARGRFFNVVDLVNRLESEARNGRAGRAAQQLARLDLIVLDELGYLPFAKSSGQLLFHRTHTP